MSPPLHKEEKMTEWWSRFTFNNYDTCRKVAELYTHCCRCCCYCCWLLFSNNCPIKRKWRGIIQVEIIDVVVYVLVFTNNISWYTVLYIHYTSVLTTAVLLSSSFKEMTTTTTTTSRWSCVSERFLLRVVNLPTITTTNICRGGGGAITTYARARVWKSSDFNVSDDDVKALWATRF